MNDEVDTGTFRIEPGSKVDLARLPTRIDPFYRSKKEYEKLLAESNERIGTLQNVMYAHDRHALLLIFQGMDSAGKGGAIKHVMSGVNPQGCQVFSFGPPCAEDLEHDFLWRAVRRLPERGRIGIFDRSYYEEVVVVRVMPELLARQRLPAEFVAPGRIWRERYRDIVRLEDFLHRNGTRIVKFFLHLSKEEQRRRLLERIEAPHKNWKAKRGDLEARARWDDYRAAYEQCLAATSSAKAPWYAVPADDKRNARLIVGRVVAETLASLDMDFPRSDAAHRAELAEMRALLEQEAGRKKSHKND
jgi:PPK2 family polyphosphate:nucleotide phosphotransferase